MSNEFNSSEEAVQLPGSLFGQSQPRHATSPRKALALADFHGQTLAVGCTCRQHRGAAEDFN